MIELDGSFGEGGGQILRSSLTLALLTGKAFHLRRVRANRQRPGLQPQHLMSVRAAVSVGQAQVCGASLRSTDLVFEPGEVRAGTHVFSIGTAGATGLVLQTVYLPLALRGNSASTITLEGGTHNDHSPAFHFLSTTWCSYLKHLGIDVDLRLVRAGFYPRGGGRVEVQIKPTQQVAPLQLLEGTPPDLVRGFSAVAGLPQSIAERQQKQASMRLREAGIERTLSSRHGRVARAQCSVW